MNWKSNVKFAPLGVRITKTEQGMLAMIFGIVLLPCMDGMAKAFHGQLPATQVTFARFAFQGLIILPFLLRQQGVAALIPRPLGPQLLRSLFMVMASVSFFAAVMLMPQADATALSFFAPLMVTLLAPALLGETLNWRQVAATLVGLVGVLIIVRPGSGVFGPVAILPLVCALFFALFVLWTRRLSAVATATSLQFAAGLLVPILILPLFGIGALLRLDWATPVALTGAQLSKLFIMGAIGCVSHYLMAQASRMAPASRLAPFMYAELLSATLIGYVAFGDFPTIWTWLGSAILVGCGLWLYRLQRAPAEVAVGPA